MFVIFECSERCRMLPNNLHHYAAGCWLKRRLANSMLAAQILHGGAAIGVFSKIHRSRIFRINVLYMMEYNDIVMRKIMLDRRLSHIKSRSFGLCCLCGVMLLGRANADDAVSPAGTADSTVGSADLLTQWFAISDAAKESQPHWMTPLVTVTPRLEQEYRYDQGWQARKGDVNIDNYYSGKSKICKW